MSLKYQLIATLGESTDVVIETLIGLLLGQCAAHGWPSGQCPEQMHLIATKSFKNPTSFLTLLDRCLKAWDKKSRVVIHYMGSHDPELTAEVSISLDGCGNIAAFKNGADRPDALDDVSTENECRVCSNFITLLVAKLAEDQDVRLHASLAGGRKTMGSDLKVAMGHFMRDGDSLSHVLRAKQHERTNDVGRLLEDAEFLAGPNTGVDVYSYFTLAPQVVFPSWRLLNQKSLRSLLVDPDRNMWRSQDPIERQDPGGLQRLMDYIDKEVMLAVSSSTSHQIRRPSPTLTVDVDWEQGGKDFSFHFCGRRIALKNAANYCLACLAFWWLEDDDRGGFPRYKPTKPGIDTEWNQLAAAYVAGLDSLVHDVRSGINTSGQNPTASAWRSVLNLKAAPVDSNGLDAWRNKLQGLHKLGVQGFFFELPGLQNLHASLSKVDLLKNINDNLLLPGASIIEEVKGAGSRPEWKLSGHAGGKLCWRIKFHGKKPPFDFDVAVDLIARHIKDSCSGLDGSAYQSSGILEQYLTAKELTNFRAAQSDAN